MFLSTIATGNSICILHQVNCGADSFWVFQVWNVGQGGGRFADSWLCQTCNLNTRLMGVHLNKLRCVWSSAVTRVFANHGDDGSNINDSNDRNNDDDHGHHTDDNHNGIGNSDTGSQDNSVDGDSNNYSTCECDRRQHITALARSCQSHVQRHSHRGSTRCRSIQEPTTVAEVTIDYITG